MAGKPEKPEANPTDVDELLQGIRVEADRLGMPIQTLGRVDRDELHLLLPNPAAHGPRLLVAAGFHGEEPAGCWGVLRYLRAVPSDVSSVRLALLPLINPSGIRRGERCNIWNENPNRGFCHTSSGKPEPSHEGALLLAALPKLLDLAADGFLSLHEDVELDRFYLYSFENRPEPGPFTAALVAAEREFFEPVADGIVEGAPCSGGVIYRQCDSSFEDMVFHEGVPRTACTETPGLLPFGRRVAANARLVEAFCNFALRSTSVSS